MNSSGIKTQNETKRIQEEVVFDRWNVPFVLSFVMDRRLEGSCMLTFIRKETFNIIVAIKLLASRHLLFVLLSSSRS